MSAARVHAEVGASVALANDDRFRGQSVSNGRPVATAALSYDDVHGPYLGGSSTAVLTRSHGLRPLRQIIYAGYAHRLTDELTIDLGAAVRRYSRYSSTDYARNINELYIGILTPRMSLRVSYSPDYDGMRGTATYAELNTLLLSRQDWSLKAHAGLLAPPRRGALTKPDPQVDWRLGVARRLGSVALSASWVGATPRLYSNRWRSGIVLTAERSF